MTVASLIPSSYEAYARIFHPLHFNGRDDVRWAAAAAANGRTAHRSMQLPGVLTRPGETVERESALFRRQYVGVLPAREWAVLGRLLRQHTASESFIAGFWEGRGVPGPLRDEGVLVLPNRTYFLAEIPFAQWATSSILTDYTPNMMWPLDRAWFLNTDIDFVSSYLGATNAAVASVLACPDLEAAPATIQEACSRLPTS